MNSCRRCALWNPEALFAPAREVCDDEDVGLCQWQPPGGLPDSWRYCPREVLSTRAGDGAGCPQFREVTTRPAPRMPAPTCQNCGGRGCYNSGSQTFLCRLCEGTGRVAP